MSNFAVRLRELRLEKNLSQFELARELKLARTTIANYEQGNRFPDQNTLLRLADFFEITLDYLLGRQRSYSNIYSLEHSSLLNKTTDNSFLSEQIDNFAYFLIEDKRERARKLIFQVIENSQNIDNTLSTIFKQTIDKLWLLHNKGDINIGQYDLYISRIEEIISMISYISITHKPDNNKKIICVSVSSEPHNIGIKLLHQCFSFRGWQSDYLESNSLHSLIEILKKYRPQIIAFSAAMLPTIDFINNFIKCKNSISQDMKQPLILVGGYLFNLYPGLWEKIGADYYAKNINETFEVIE